MMVSATGGNPREQNDFIDNMLEADPVLAGLYETRLFALSGKPWKIVADENARTETGGVETDRKLAEEIAQYCSEKLAAAGVDRAARHLADAIGRSYSVCEIMWTSDGARVFPSAILPVPPNAIQADFSSPSTLRVHTEENQSPGEPLISFPMKFIQHVPRMLGGSPFRGGALRRVAAMHLYRRYGMKWWVSYLEMFGTPYRKATYPANATDELKDGILAALESFGHLGYGAFPTGAEFELIESSKGGDSCSWPHPKLVEKIDQWYAITILGQNLTSNVEGGSFAAAKVHDQVRADILAADIAGEAETIERQLLRPMVALAYGPNAPVPKWVRVINEAKDLEAQGRVISLAVNQLGLAVSKGWAHAALDIPLLAGENADDPIPGMPAPAAPDAGGMPGPAVFHAANRPLPRGATKKTSPVAILRPWIAEVAEQSAKQAKAVTAMLTRSVGKTKTLEAATARLSETIEDIPNGTFTDLIYDMVLASAMVGRYNAEKRLPSNRRLMADEGPTFAALPYRQAIGALRNRLALTPEQFASLDRDARSRAGRIAGEYNLAIVRDAYASIETQLSDGGTVRDFRRAITEMPKKDGWAGENTWHANLVFQQNSMMAYHSAHLARFEEAGVEHWKFSGYSTSCAICSQVIEQTRGKVFAMSDLAFYPPIHFNCDCWAEPVLKEPDAVIKASDVEAPAYRESQNAPGAFRYNPRQFAKMDPFDLTSVPTLLRGAFRSFAQAAGWDTVG
jgi:phage gp29-like protein